nr:hypothetical protein [uncultured Mediterranean phage uvMED]
MESNLKALTEQVKALDTRLEKQDSRLEKLEEAYTKMPVILAEIAHVLKDKEKLNATVDKLQDRVIDLEKVTNVNSLTLAKSERFIWILVTVAAATIGKLLI